MRIARLASTQRGRRLIMRTLQFMLMANLLLVVAGKPFKTLASRCSRKESTKFKFTDLKIVVLVEGAQVTLGGLLTGLHL